jgi:hypothetical protein
MSMLEGQAAQERLASVVAGDLNPIGLPHIGRTEMLRLNVKIS